MGILDGKTIIVTGATSGIGEATALEVAREGGVAVLAARREDRGEAIASKIRQEGGTALFVRTDVTREEDVKNLVLKTVKEYGRLDGAFNNAGTVGAEAFGPLDTVPIEAYDSLMNLNLRSVFLCMKYEIQQMKKNGKGAIVNSSSVGGIRSAPGLAVYVGAKHGVVGLTKSACLDYGEQGIRVNCILPGPTETEIWDTFPDGQTYFQGFVETTSLKRYAKPIELAKPVVFLLSDGASFINGALLLVDGGATAR